MRKVNGFGNCLILVEEGKSIQGKTTKFKKEIEEMNRGDWFNTKGEVVKDTLEEHI